MEKPIEAETNTVIRDEKGRYIKGVSGNPMRTGGRPAGSVSINTAIRKKLLKIPKGQKKTYLELFVISVLRKAIVEQDVAAIRLIWNYIEGLPVLPLDANINMRVSNLVEIIKHVANETGDNKLSEEYLEQPDFIHGENTEPTSLGEGERDNTGG